jgi:hypothetical protein
MFTLPEPEIRYPTGTEMKVMLTGLPAGGPVFEPAPSAELPKQLVDWFEEQPFLLTRSNGRTSEDEVNIGFIGTREQLVRAFRAAGWSEAAPRGIRSFSRLWHAFSMQQGYADAPASRLRYEGVEPEFVFQKSLNTIAMRHHVRVWHSDSVSPEIWLGAATHDIAIRFDSVVRGFTHKIDPRIDLERSKLVNDLAFAGCSAPGAYVSRPAAARTSSDGKGVVSDGRIAVVPLRDCVVSQTEPDPGFSKPARSLLVRLVRRVILETRQYIIRENAYYWGFRLLQWTHANTQDSSPAEN